MSTLSELLRKQMTRWHALGIGRSHQLRRRLAYYVARHGFEIGDYSVGAPNIRLWGDGSRLKIGRYCSVAAGVTFVLGGNHRTDTITTFPLGLAAGTLGPDDRTYSRGDIVIGSDVWIGSNATILSGVSIGDGAVVGAGSVVIHDVPPYTMVFGNPARQISKRFSDHLIEQLLALRWWDLPAEQVQALRPVLQSNDVDGFIAACRKLKGLPASRARAVPVAGGASSRSADDSPDLRKMQVVSFIRSELAEFSVDDLDVPFNRLGLDSFAMLTLRTRLEQALAVIIDDESWTSLVTPADLVRVVSTLQPDAKPAATSTPAGERRAYRLNMPQMALEGMSESWLFKELGDVHWSLITRNLGMPSSELKDAGGARLYATFTRFQLDSSAPLAAYGENEPVKVEARAVRYGAGMFFSDASLEGEGKSAKVRIMSSFSKYGEAGANTSLLKGQPEIPAGCAIPDVSELPRFGQEYRARRGERLSEPIFECSYDIVPYHDINGVGLLYFAAYPIICDICATRYAGAGLATEFSTSYRDVFYFANSDPEETLIFRLHGWRADPAKVHFEASISRKSDDVLMAYAVTTKHASRSRVTA